MRDNVWVQPELMGRHLAVRRSMPSLPYLAFAIAWRRCDHPALSGEVAGLRVPENVEGVVSGQNGGNRRWLGNRPMLDQGVTL